MSKLMCFAAPIIPGKEDTWRAFMKELQTTRKAEFIASRKNNGVRERTFLQETPHGSTVIVTLKGDDPAGSFAKIGQGTDEFTKWFVASVKDIHGFDLSAPPPGPMPEMILDSGA